MFLVIYTSTSWVLNRKFFFCKKYRSKLRILEINMKLENMLYYFRKLQRGYLYKGKYFRFKLMTSPGEAIKAQEWVQHTVGRRWIMKSIEKKNENNKHKHLLKKINLVNELLSWQYMVINNNKVEDVVTSILCCPLTVWMYFCWIFHEQVICVPLSNKMEYIYSGVIYTYFITIFTSLTIGPLIFAKNILSIPQNLDTHVSFSALPDHRDQVRRTFVLCSAFKFYLCVLQNVYLLFPPKVANKFKICIIKPHLKTSRTIKKAHIKTKPELKCTYKKHKNNRHQSGKRDHWKKTKGNQVHLWKMITEGDRWACMRRNFQSF